MKLPQRIPRSARGFTMVEIALSLAIIGFALIAIIGVLPAGLSVQKDNREQTVINLDAAFLMNAIRNGAQGQDDLTNYIVAIFRTNTTLITAGKWPTRAGGGYPPNYVNRATVAYTRSTYALNGLTNNYTRLTSGSNVLGYLSVPKYMPFLSPYPGVAGYWSNDTSAIFRAINAPAVDQGLSQPSLNFAFQYQVTIEIVPSAQSAYLADGNWYSLTAPTVINSNTSGFNPSTGADLAAQYLQDNLYDVRLTFRWPVLSFSDLPGGVHQVVLGGGRQVFRSSVAGSVINAEPRTQDLLIPHFVRPQAYSAVTPQ